MLATLGLIMNNIPEIFALIHFGFSVGQMLKYLHNFMVTFEESVEKRQCLFNTCIRDFYRFLMNC